MAVFAKIRAGDLKLDQEVKKKNGAEGETRNSATPLPFQRIVNTAYFRSTPSD